MSAQTLLIDSAPEHVAVVLVDFQNDFCHPAAGGDPVPNGHNAETAIRANHFARRAQQRGAHVIYTQQVLDFDRLDERQRRWERPDGLCAKASWGGELYLEPLPNSVIVAKDRFDIWRSEEFTDALDRLGVDGLVIAGVELRCCVLYAVLGADERGYRYIVPQDLVSGLDEGDGTYNRAVRDYLRSTHNAPESGEELLAAWS